jgi:hypothetical protein
MDFGKARYRQAHRLPPQKWELGVLVLAIIAIIAIVVMSWPGVVTAGEKVTICHVPPGNPENAHTITIDKHALKAHLGDNEEGLHGGDYYGECQPTETPTPTPAPTETPTPTDTPRPTATPDEGGETGGGITSRSTMPPTDTE